MPLDQTREPMPSAADLTVLNDHLLRSMYTALGEDVCPIAVKVWSAVLGEALWVVANDLPIDAWPEDVSVYTHAEVKMLTQVGPDTLEWVHATKQIFGARVIAGRGRRSAHPEAPT